MLIEVLKAKLHQVTVTDSNLNYMGSLEVDEALLHKAGLMEFEKVQVINLNTGDRAETYLIKGKKGSGCVSLNGGMARVGEPGDKLLVLSFCLAEPAEARRIKPTIVFVDSKNRPVNKKGI